MAPVPLQPEVNYTGAAVLVLHILSAVYCFQNVAASLGYSIAALSPSQDVRLRLERRRKLVPLFAGLALLGFSFAAYSAVSYISLSYGAWADERGHIVSESGSGNTTINSSSDGAVDITQLVVYKIRWLADTPIYQDAFEIVAEKARRFWWGQQIDLAFVPWSVLVAIEGTRRGIPNLFSFLSLAHLVNLSCAQNLFFVALLLTPAPLPKAERPSTRLTRTRDAAFPPKPLNWCLKPGFFLLTVMGSYASIYLLPYAAKTSSFSRVLGISRALTFAPCVLQSLAPVSWGTVHPHPHKANAAFTDLFRFMSLMSVVLHGTATFTGLRYNVPDSHFHRHSKLLPWDIEERSRWERTTTAVGKILGSTRDHPIVAAVGYDVLLSGLSIGLWAAVRALGAGDILTSAVPLYRDNSGTSTTVKLAASKANNEDHVKADEASATGTVRRSGRQHKPRIPSVSTTASHDDDDREPPTPRRRGRPRKARSDAEEDEPYQPSPGEEVSAEGDRLPAQEVDLEASAIAWGLTTVGGLGLGSAGVFGGECLAR